MTQKQKAEFAALTAVLAVLLFVSMAIPIEFHINTNGITDKSYSVLNILFVYMSNIDLPQYSGIVIPLLIVLWCFFLFGIAFAVYAVIAAYRCFFRSEEKQNVSSAQARRQAKLLVAFSATALTVFSVLMFLVVALIIDIFNKNMPSKYFENTFAYLPVIFFGIHLSFTVRFRNAVKYGSAAAEKVLASSNRVAGDKPILITAIGMLLTAVLLYLTPLLPFLQVTFVNDITYFNGYVGLFDMPPTCARGFSDATLWTILLASGFLFSGIALVVLRLFRNVKVKELDVFVRLYSFFTILLSAPAVTYLWNALFAKLSYPLEEHMTASMFWVLFYFAAFALPFAFAIYTRRRSRSDAWGRLYSLDPDEARRRRLRKTLKKRGYLTEQEYLELEKRRRAHPNAINNPTDQGGVQ